ncbi:hypothetical protein [Caballeronia sp. dw_276]|uniref:hypothetical protein n=1 Tax=Caballeronia sp. dw_276 TaxID=2719795 RepID=UPI001BD5D7DC|nr:hypothetical protein [Caballeronia sp. dw_276]
MSLLKERAAIAMNVRVALADVAPDRQVTLGAIAMVDDLGNMLWHMKYGEDRRGKTLRRAALLLASRIGGSNRFKRTRTSGGGADAVFVSFAERAIAEWVADRCSACGGYGMLGRGQRATLRVSCPTCSHLQVAIADSLQFSRWPAPIAAANGLRFSPWPRVVRSACPTCLDKGFVERKAASKNPHVCSHCNGTGREPVNHAQRAAAIGVPLDQYHRRWLSRFEWLADVLTRIDSQTEEQFAWAIR